MGVSLVGEGRGAGHLCQSWAPRPPEGPASPVHTRSSVPSKPQGNVLQLSPNPHEQLENLVAPL